MLAIKKVEKFEYSKNIISNHLKVHNQNEKLNYKSLEEIDNPDYQNIINIKSILEVPKISKIKVNKTGQNEQFTEENIIV